MKHLRNFKAFPKRLVAAIAFFAYTLAFHPLLYASVAPVQQQSEMWKTVSQDDFIARTYGNLAEKFDRPVVSWKLRGSFNALDATWKDEKLSYELFLFETNGQLSFAGDIDIIEESCCFDVGFDLQSWWLVVSGDEKDLESFEWNVDTASKTYARLEHLRSSRPQASVASEDDERKRSAESGLANKVSSERKYDENFAHRLKMAGNEQNGYRHFAYDANGNVIEEKDTVSENPNEETSGLLPATMSVTSNANGETVYKSDYAWGYFKDAPTGSSYGGSYKRTYEWDSRNLLIASSDNTHQVYYTYDANGERTNKFSSKAETLYFNTFWNWHKDSAIPLGQYSKNIYLGTTRLVTKLHRSVNELPASQVSAKNCYYYHSDHLGSAQLITDSKGEEYQRLEYTPYGELWIEKTSSEASAKYLPYKFTGKERDEETGLYYFGARYLDAKYSRWLSADPAFGDYIPLAPVDDEAKKHNSNLPGMGGIFNTVNLQLYHYAGNNPMKYVDPDGKAVTNNTDDNIYVKFENPVKDKNGNIRHGMLLGPGEKYDGRVDGVITPDGTVKKVTDSDDSPLPPVNIDVKKDKDGKYKFSLGLSGFVNFLGDLKKKIDKDGKENDTSRTFSPDEVEGSPVEPWLERAEKEFGDPSQWNSYKGKDYEDSI